MLSQNMNLAWTQLAVNFSTRIAHASISVLADTGPLGDPQFVTTIESRLSQQHPDDSAALQVLQLTMPRDSLRETSDFDVNWLFKRLENMLRHRLLLVRRQDDAVIWHVPSLSFLELSAAIAFDGRDQVPIQWVRSSGILERDDINALHRENQHPIGMAEAPLWLGDARVIVDPFIFAIHDIFHGYCIGRLHKYARQFAYECYDAMKAYTSDPVLHDVLNTMMNHAIDIETKDFTISGLVAYIWGPGLSELARLKSLVGLESPEYRVYLQAFQDMSYAILAEVSPLLHPLATKAFRSYLARTIPKE